VQRTWALIEIGWPGRKLWYEFPISNALAGQCTPLGSVHLKCVGPIAKVCQVLRIVSLQIRARTTSHVVLGELALDCDSTPLNKHDINGGLSLSDSPK
jgi:hypothetical protein